MTESKFNHCSEEMTLFLKDFFEDIGSLIFKIKLNVYKIVNLNLNN